MFHNFIFLHTELQYEIHLDKCKACSLVIKTAMWIGVIWVKFVSLCRWLFVLGMVLYHCVYVVGC